MTHELKAEGIASRILQEYFLNCKNEGIPFNVAAEEIMAVSLATAIGSLTLNQRPDIQKFFAVLKGKVEQRMVTMHTAAMREASSEELH